MSVPNLFDAETRQRMADLYGKPIKPAAPSMASYRAQLQAWCEMADKKHTVAELEAIAADQARRIKVMK